MKKVKAKMALLLLCFALTANVSAITVGVKSGDYIKWDISVSVGTYTASGWMKINIQSISGTHITGTYEANVAGYAVTPQPQSFDLDVSTGIGSLGGFIIPANITEGQKIPGQTATVHIVDHRGRNAVYVNATIPMMGMSGQIYWDQKTGVLLEAISSGRTETPQGEIDFRYSIRVAETNIAGLPVGGGFDWWLWVIIIVVVAGAAVAAVLILRRRKPPAPPMPPRAQPPPPPPPP